MKLGNGAKCVKPLSSYTPEQTAVGACKFLLSGRETSGHITELVSGVTITPDNYLAWDSAYNAQRLNISATVRPSGNYFTTLAGAVIKPTQSFIALVMTGNLEGGSKKFQICGDLANGSHANQVVDFQNGNITVVDSAQIVNPTPNYTMYPGGNMSLSNIPTDACYLLAVAANNVDPGRTFTAKRVYSADTTRAVTDLNSVQSVQGDGITLRASANISYATDTFFQVANGGAATNLNQLHYGSCVFVFDGALPTDAEINAGLQWMFDTRINRGEFVAYPSWLHLYGA